MTRHVHVLHTLDSSILRSDTQPCVYGLMKSFFESRQMCERQTIAVKDPGICLSVCHMGWVVQKWLNGSMSCLMGLKKHCIR